MTFAWREHAEALDEFRAAAKWYETNRPNWGHVFMDAVDSAIESILDPSISWGRYQGRRRTPPVYSRSVAGFPFNIIYLRIDDEVYIVAYAHERRRPGYWERRYRVEWSSAALGPTPPTGAGLSPVLRSHRQE